MRNYIGLIHKGANSDYGVSFPDFPGVISAGTDLDDARRMATDALVFHLEGLAVDGIPIAEQSSLETVMADPGNKNGVAILVGVKMDTKKAVRVNVTLPEDVLRQIDRFAEAKGLTRSGFIALAALQEIDRDDAA